MSDLMLENIARTQEYIDYVNLKDEIDNLSAQIRERFESIASYQILRELDPFDTRWDKLIILNTRQRNKLMLMRDRLSHELTVLENELSLIQSKTDC